MSLRPVRELMNNVSKSDIEAVTQETANPSHWAIIGTFWILFLGVLTIAQSFFIPVLTSILLALIFSPLRRALGKIGIRPGLSAFLILAALIFTLLVGSYFLSSPVMTRLESLPALLPEAIEKIETFSGVIEPMIKASDQLNDLTGQVEGPAEVVVREGGILSAIAVTTPRVLGQIGFTLALMMFLISSGDLFYEKLVQVMPTIKDKRRAVSLVKTIEQHVSSYFSTITLINAGLGVAVGVMMWAMGMPDPVLFGLAAFLLNYIPFVGAILGVTVTFLVAVLGSGSIISALLPALAYFGLTTVEGQLISPLLVGKRLRLNAVVVFLAVAIGAWMWSFMGMFLAIPVLIVIKALSQEIESLWGLGEFLGGRTDTTKPEQKILNNAL